MSQVRLTFLRTCSADWLWDPDQSRCTIFQYYNARNAMWIDWTISHLPICPLGAEKTLVLMIQHAPNEISKTNWTHLRNDVRKYGQSCATCRKMDARHKTIRVSKTVSHFQTYGTDSDWYHWAHSEWHGFQVYHRYHRYVYTARRTLPQTGRISVTP